MRATLDGRILAETDDVIEAGGYHYFPRRAVQMQWLEPADKTPRDLECPHGVRFFDVVLDGVRYERVAWSYEKPQPVLRAVDQRIGFWEQVEVG